jgi:phage terminase large subunit GpA-like protein
VPTKPPSRRTVEVRPGTSPEGLQQLREVGRRAIRAYLNPPPRLTVSDWADQKRMLSREYAAEPGQWRTDRAPYQRGIMDAFSDFAIEKVVVMTSAQIGKTEILFNVIGFFVDEDPSPILKVRPNKEDAEQWSKTRLAPTIRDTPALRDKIRDPRSRDSGNTLLIKEFPGGHITIVGANAPAGLAAKPIRVVLCDEVDKYPASAGTEGDPVALAEKRTTTFWNRKIGLFSTPSLKGHSRIDEAFREGDQRYYEVPCPACGFFQRLIWDGLRWEEGKPHSAAYECASCKTRIRERDKPAMLRAGRWRATAVAKGPIASFHLNALYSPWARWSELVNEWLLAQEKLERLQAFVNAVKGETWEDKGGGLDPERLESRKEAYLHEVPAGIGVLTMGVDVQADRLEYIIRGWGVAEESWLIDHDVILGDPAILPGEPNSPWDELDKVRKEQRLTPSGRSIPLSTCCIDSGYHTDAVYAYCKPRFAQRVFPVKGSSTPARPIVPRKPSTNNKARVRLFELGTEAAKDVIYARLRRLLTGPGFMHLADWTSPAYFEQITAERSVRRQVAGRWVRRYELPIGRRSEALDCEVYALAALRLTNIQPANLDQLIAEFGAEPTDSTILVLDPKPETDVPGRRPSPRSWRDRWRP